MIEKLIVPGLADVEIPLLVFSVSQLAPGSCMACQLIVAPPVVSTANGEVLSVPVLPVRESITTEGTSSLVMVPVADAVPRMALVTLEIARLKVSFASIVASRLESGRCYTDRGGQDYQRSPRMSGAL